MIESVVSGAVPCVVASPTAPFTLSPRYGIARNGALSMYACSSRERAFTSTETPRPPELYRCTLNVPTIPSLASPIRYWLVPCPGMVESGMVRLIAWMSAMSVLLQRRRTRQVRGECIGKGAQDRIRDEWPERAATHELVTEHEHPAREIARPQFRHRTRHVGIDVPRLAEILDGQLCDQHPGRRRLDHRRLRGIDVARRDDPAPVERLRARVAVRDLNERRPLEIIHARHQRREGIGRRRREDPHLAHREDGRTVDILAEAERLSAVGRRHLQHALEVEHFRLARRDVGHYLLLRLGQPLILDGVRDLIGVRSPGIPIELPQEVRTIPERGGHVAPTGCFALSFAISSRARSFRDCPSFGTNSSGMVVRLMIFSIGYSSGLPMRMSPVVNSRCRYSLGSFENPNSQRSPAIAASGMRGERGGLPTMARSFQPSASPNSGILRSNAAASCAARW